MDNKKNELSLTRYDNETRQKNNIDLSFNLENFLVSQFTKDPRYAWETQDYVYNYLQKACCCFYQDGDEEHSQEIETSIKNSTKNCTVDSPIFIATKKTITKKIIGFARINYHKKSHAEITHFLCPENASKTTFLEKIMKNIFVHNKTINHIKIHSGTIQKKDAWILNRNGFVLTFPPHSRFITTKLPFFSLYRQQYESLKKND